MDELGLESSFNRAKMIRAVELHPQEKFNIYTVRNKEMFSTGFCDSYFGRRNPEILAIYNCSQMELTCGSNLVSRIMHYGGCISLGFG